MFEILFEYLSMPFVRYALAVGVLIAITSSFLGVTLVLKRQSLIGDGLSHLAFGVTCVAAAFGLTNDSLLVFPVTIAAAVILGVKDSAKVKGDTAIAIMSVCSLAIGYLLVNLFPNSPNVSGDVCASLFGSTSILTLNGSDIWVCIVMAAAVALFFVLFYNRIFAMTFDEKFMKASGLNPKAYKLVFSVITAIVIALSMRLVGSLLITALIVFPAISAMRLFDSYKKVSVFAVCFGAVSSFLGIIASVLAGTPVGSTIVCADLIFFLCCVVAGKIKTLVLSRKNSSKETERL